MYFQLTGCFYSRGQMFLCQPSAKCPRCPDLAEARSYAGSTTQTLRCARNSSMGAARGTRTTSRWRTSVERCVRSSVGLYPVRCTARTATCLTSPDVRFVSASIRAWWVVLSYESIVCVMCSFSNHQASVRCERCMSQRAHFSLF